MQESHTHAEAVLEILLHKWAVPHRKRAHAFPGAGDDRRGGDGPRPRGRSEMVREQLVHMTPGRNGDTQRHRLVDPDDDIAMPVQRDHVTRADLCPLRLTDQGRAPATHEPDEGIREAPQSHLAGRAPGLQGQPQHDQPTGRRRGRQRPLLVLQVQRILAGPQGEIMYGHQDSRSTIPFFTFQAWHSRCVPLRPGPGD